MAKERQFAFSNPRENLPLIFYIADTYKNDWSIIAPSKKIDLTDVFFEAQKRYVREQGEQFLRPLFFHQIQGDCDDQTIYILSFLLYNGVPVENLYFIIGKDNMDRDIHIAVGLKTKKGILLIDSFPGLTLGETLHSNYDLLPVENYALSSE